MSLKKTRHFRNFLSQSNLLLPTLPSVAIPHSDFLFLPLSFTHSELFFPSSFSAHLPLSFQLHCSYESTSPPTAAISIFLLKENKTKKKSTKKFPLKKKEKGNNPENETSEKPMNNPVTVPSSTHLYAALDSVISCLFIYLDYKTNKLRSEI